MRFFLLPILFLCQGLLLAAARADTNDSTHPPPSDSTPLEMQAESQLDQLYLALKAERSEVAARRIASSINKELSRTGGATANLLIEWGMKAAREKNYAAANDLLDQAIVLYPDYAEAWNSRAMLHVMTGNYSMAIADLSKALTIEPRHFGALSGLAGILRMTGKDAMALDVYRRLLEIYPMHRRAQHAVMELTEDITDEAL